jgi:hypothetical protein
MISLKKIIILTFLPLITFSLNSCGSLPGGDARKYPPDPKLRVAKNIEEGRGMRFNTKNLGNGGGTFEFASSNELWRATLDTIDFMPLASVNYGGGIIVTDWYSTKKNSDESIKISVRFLTNEIRSDSLDIKIFNRKCIAQSNCVISEKNGDLGPELKSKILKTATIYKEKKKEKK